MAKIGTAHIEIKPVVNEEALDALAQRVGEVVRQAIEEATARGVFAVEFPDHNVYKVGDPGDRSPEEVRDVLSDLGHNIEKESAR
jgi:hypothetical protein